MASKIDDSFGKYTYTLLVNYCIDGRQPGGVGYTQSFMSKPESNEPIVSNFIQFLLRDFYDIKLNNYLESHKGNKDRIMSIKFKFMMPQDTEPIVLCKYETLAGIGFDNLRSLITDNMVKIIRKKLLEQVG